ncbi:hypothetical protein B296_00004766 [Ensete ventricosum]|uniref:Uncharacterized protein n=1 Tax=Ensete ventricosum TaxID=4639 RepID=A0A427ASJ6_ENSVE|nr:hypothetical protein B296_00004766 [Ensete ventricosum]
MGATMVGLKRVMTAKSAIRLVVVGTTMDNGGAPEAVAKVKERQDAKNAALISYDRTLQDSNIVLTSVGG